MCRHIVSFYGIGQHCTPLMQHWCGTTGLRAFHLEKAARIMLSDIQLLGAAKCMQQSCEQAANVSRRLRCDVTGWTAEVLLAGARQPEAAEARCMAF